MCVFWISLTWSIHVCSYFSRKGCWLGSANCRNLYWFWVFWNLVCFWTFGSTFEVGRIPLGKKIKHKKYIGTKCTFLTKFYFPTRMLHMLKIDTYEKNKLSSGRLARAKSGENGGVYINAIILPAIKQHSDCKNSF